MTTEPTTNGTRAPTNGQPPFADRSPTNDGRRPARAKARTRPDRRRRRARRGRAGRRGRGDRGFATVWTAGAIVALFLVATVVLGIGAATVTRHRVAGAADLAALAAADYAPDGEQSACGWARWVADRMEVTLVSCRLDGWDALVQTSAEPPGPLARFGAATAHARAGPADG